jgi:hypothetical protein
MRVWALIFAATALPLPVMAQPWRQSCGYGSDQSCVTINFQLTMPLKDANATDWTGAVAKENATLFDIVNHECKVLQQSVPGDCHMVQLNVSSSVNPQRGMPGANATISATANAVFQLGATPAAAPNR